MNLANFIPALAALSSLLWWWWLSNWPTQALGVALGVLIFNGAAALLISVAATDRGRWKFALLPLLMQLITLSYLTISGNRVLIISTVGLLAILTYVYWRYVYFYLNRPARYTSFSLENFSFYLGFLLALLLGSLAFGLLAFLNYNLAWLLVGVALILWLLIYQNFWVSKFAFKKIIKFPILILVLMVELFWLLTFLPLDYNLLGFLWATAYYLVSVLISDHLGGRWQKIKIKTYLILVGSSWLLLLLTARWI